MGRNYRIFIGMGGVPPRENPEAHIWERKLHWVMVGVALLALPAFYLEVSHQSGLLSVIGQVLDSIILTAFVAELGWMLYLTRQKLTYVMYNWLDLLIIFGAAMSFVGVEAEWIPLVRLLRLAYVSLLLARVLGSLRKLYAPTAIPYLLGWGAVTLALAGAGFFWLEPTVHSYSQGLWLAFTSGATVGYGDIVPTTNASRVFAVMMVVLGFTMLSVVTASLSAFFVGEEEKVLRREMHRDIKALREDVKALRGELKVFYENKASSKSGRKETI
ncbi:potassium channel family protein [Sulfurirhabdus autotrophica]|uniref:Voltage-gated potassium channel n=1 Tax=Sulfurirhabdus autotrophica TaxID=1706046 RepID=A0A4R3XXL0_9PROT|nr:potassium channel family protein [Sulfurirhabdus autotrophica]TCV82363.1 voltage-gated potassium channel [Sulfurirhabdus autotrophica]